jgi:hypothetical protein
MNRYILLINLLYTSICVGQIPDSTLVEGEKIAIELLQEITVTPLNLSPEERTRYYHLRRKVRKVHPYALKAKSQLLEIEDDFNYVETRREKRKIAKLHDRWLQDNFTKELKKLTRSEGRVLIKLIHLETRINAYQLIKNYRNGFTAMLWQRLAKFYDGDLKAEYNPDEIKEDFWIDHILWRMKKDNKALLK